jgi:hypothetical protein
MRHYGELGPDPRYWAPDRDVEVDPWYLNGPADPYEGSGIPAPMLPGVQPWQLGEPVGEPVADDWRRLAFEEAASWCGHCGGSGLDGNGFACGYCGGSGAAR